MLFFIDGALINASLVLTSGVFLSGYMVFLGASDFLVGLLNNALTWASIAALFSFLIFERLERRKRFLLTLLTISRLLVGSVIFLPLLFGSEALILGLSTAMVVIGNVLWGIYSVGFSVWMMGSFSRESRSAFVFRRIFWLRIAFTITTIVMGYVLDWSGKSFTGFLIVFLASLVLSAGDCSILLKIDEPANPVTRNIRLNRETFFEPLMNRNYRSFLFFIFLYYVSLTLSNSFSPLYLIKYLQFDYSFISFINVISYVFLIVCTRFWSKMEGKVGQIRVLRLAGLIAIIEILIYGFLTQNTTFLLFLAPVFSGIGNSGFNVFIFNFRYDLMPENKRTIYEGWFGAIFGLGVLLGPIFGGLVMDWLPQFENRVIQYSKFQLLYLLSFALSATALCLSFRRRSRSAANF